MKLKQIMTQDVEVRRPEERQETAAEVVARIRQLYVGSLGYESGHLEEEKERTIKSQRLTAPARTASTNWKNV